jgi:hypothetical protein
LLPWYRIGHKKLFHIFSYHFFFVWHICHQHDTERVKNISSFGGGRSFARKLLDVFLFFGKMAEKLKFRIFCRVFCYSVLKRCVLEKCTPKIQFPILQDTVIFPLAPKEKETREKFAHFWKLNRHFI